MSLRKSSADDLSPGELVKLVERARAREQEAFAVLFDYYNAKICTYLTRLAHNDSVVYDLAQEVFLKAWLALPGIHDPACFRPWLYKIATNEAYNYLRRIRPSDDCSLVEGEAYLISNNLIVDGPEKQIEETELITWILGQLPLRHSTCLILQIEGFSQKEIAEMVGITEKHVSVSISRAREQCRLLRERKEN